MHEFSICQSIVDTVVEEMEKLDPPPRRLVKTRVVVGELRQIVSECLQFAYESLTKGTPAEGSALDIVPATLTAKCGDRRQDGPLATQLAALRKLDS